MMNDKILESLKSLVCFQYEEQNILLKNVNYVMCNSYASGDI